MQSESTIKTYTKALTLFNDKIILEDPDQTYNNLKNSLSNKGTLISFQRIKTILCAINWVLRDNNYDPKLISQYSEYIKKLREESDKRQFDPETDANKIPAWSHFIDISNKLHIKHNENYNNKKLHKLYIISLLFTKLPPRRVLDYACMFYIEGNQIDDHKQYINVNDLKNYLFYNKSLDKALFIFNRYKTVNTYKTQVFKVNNNIKSELLNYIISNNIKHNMSLFGIKNLSDDWQSYFSILIKRAFNGATVNILRHSFITYLYQNPPETPQLKIISEFMAHSLQTQLSYRRNLK